MYRFIRTATLKNAACMTRGMQFAAEIVAHIKERYSIDMKQGIEIFGTHTDPLAFRFR